MAKEHMRQCVYGGLQGLASLQLVVFLYLYMHNQGLDAPKSLQDILGPDLSVVWIWGTIGLLSICGILSFIYKPLAMRIESIIRVMAAFPLAGYCLALFAADSNRAPLITAGFVIALAILQIARWMELTFFKLPSLEIRKVLEGSIKPPE